MFIKMNSSQINVINTPLVGTMTYNIDDNKIYVYNGNKWDIYESVYDKRKRIIEKLLS